MTHIYNEIEPNANEWLNNLMQAGEIPHGRIDARSIKDIHPADLEGVKQFHTFAGIGGWPLALRLAGWEENEEVWTGSCPCQPFSSAGKGKGEKDERHLWPDFLRLIAERRPATVFGEQVASKAGRQWVTRVRSDLEALGYRVGVADLCAASVGAPHIRQRLYWVASRPLSDDQGVGLETESDDAGSRQRAGEKRDLIARPNNNNNARRLGNGNGNEDNAEWRFDQQGRDTLGRNEQALSERPTSDDSIGRSGETGGLADEYAARLEECRPSRIGGGEEGGGPRAAAQRDSADGRLADDDDDERQQARGEGRPQQNGVAVSAWSDYRIVPCTDGKARRTGARVFPLAHGLPRGVGQSGSELGRLARRASRARIGMLKGSGNAIVPELAAEFIAAYLDARNS